MGKSKTWMKVIAMSVFVASVVQSASSAMAQEGDTIALVGVNVIPMDTERVLENQTVVVKGDRIIEVGAVDVVDLPDGATVVEGNGGYLIPGLVDTHSHLLDNQDALILNIANGVTTIRDPNADYAGTGKDILGWRDQIAAGELLGPTIVAAKSLGALPPQFASVFNNIDTATSPWLSIDRTAFGLAMDPASGRGLVNDAREQGYDIIKVNWFLSRDTFDSIVATAAELGMPVVAHVPADVGIEHMIRSGGEIQHSPNLIAFVAKDYERQPGANYLDEFDLSEAEQKLPELVTLMAQTGVAFTPTMASEVAAFDLFASLPDWTQAPMFQRPEYRYVKPATLAEWQDPTGGEVAVVLRDAGASSLDEILPPVEQREQMRAHYLRQLKALVDAEVSVLTGTDASALGVVWGFSEHRELELFVEAGLTPYQALAAATRIPSEVMGDPTEWGTIAEGKRADMVLLNANPLDDITNTHQIAGVMVRGRWLTQADLQGMLDDIAAKYEAQAAGAVVMEPFSGEAFSGLAPAGWNELEPGVYARSNPDVDPTMLVQMAAPNTEPETFALGLLERYGVTELPDPKDHIESAHLAWDIYLIEHEVGVLGLALSEKEGTAYLVLLVAPPDQADRLAKSAFFPALNALAPTQ
jgi:imidazolonepropionase-like amidohydrolase